MSEFFLTSPKVEKLYSRIHFTCESVQWSTPAELYDALFKEFSFTLDPCPLKSDAFDGLLISWAGQRVFCNPPYGPSITKWLSKAREANIAVFLLPARTDTIWFHHYAPNAHEVRFLRGRLKFGNCPNGAPFPSLLLIFGAKL